MPVVHVVLLEFSPQASSASIKDTCTALLALQQRCLHPETQEPYILSARGGVDISPEGLQKGMTHGFVLEFASTADRNHYVHADAAHRAFVDRMRDVVINVTVLDFVPGEW